MTDTTPARRALLAVLLDRAERGVLLPPEGPLLRALVTAEQAATARTDVYREDVEASATRAEQAGAALREVLALLTPVEVSDGAVACYEATKHPIHPDDVARWWAALDSPTPKQRHWRGTDGADIAKAYMDAQATLARVRELAERWAYVPGLKDSPRTSLLRAIDGPSPTPDDAQATADRAALDNAIVDDIARRAVEGDGTGQCLGVLAGNQAPGTLVNVNDTRRRAGCDPAPSRPTPGDAFDVEIVHTNNIPTDWAWGGVPRCPARYTGPPPGIDIKWGARSDYQCDLRPHARGTDHAARLGHGPFAWTDDIAVWPTDDAPSAPCIHLRDGGCCTGPGYCAHACNDDRPPCPTQLDDGTCAGVCGHPGDCTPNADDIPSAHEVDAPSEPQP